MWMKMKSKGSERQRNITEKIASLYKEIKIDKSQKGKNVEE